jgi:hypothetical protein
LHDPDRLARCMIHCSTQTQLTTASHTVLLRRHLMPATNYEQQRPTSPRRPLPTAAAANRSDHPSGSDRIGSDRIGSDRIGSGETHQNCRLVSAEYCTGSSPLMLLAAAVLHAATRHKRIELTSPNILESESAERCMLQDADRLALHGPLCMPPQAAGSQPAPLCKRYEPPHPRKLASTTRTMQQPQPLRTPPWIGPDRAPRAQLGERRVLRWQLAADVVDLNTPARSNAPKNTPLCHVWVSSPPRPTPQNTHPNKANTNQ